MAKTNITSVTQDPNSERDAMVRFVREDARHPLAESGNKELGRTGEDLAAQYLSLKGYTILERNWRCAFGEADIIAEDGSTVVLVEVKTRMSNVAWTDQAPELAVDARKRSKYQKLALMYLSLQTRVDTVRFDVVAVNVYDDQSARLRHLVGAYEWDY
ncbi:MAG: YraN family protein [Atopobiaceae bacterium]|nr:YraN family protein [Atopobiaceae bacterium]